MGWLNLFRRPSSPAPKHPTPEMAADAITQGACIYAPMGPCSGAVRPVVLHNHDDDLLVPVCRAHFGRLKSMPADDLDRLGRHLANYQRVFVG